MHVHADVLAILVMHELVMHVDAVLVVAVIVVSQISFFADFAVSSASRRAAAVVVSASMSKDWLKLATTLPLPEPPRPPSTRIAWYRGYFGL
jgi:hypothetical protein